MAGGNDFERFMRGMMGAGAGHPDPFEGRSWLTPEEAADFILDHRRIENLKPGDKVRWKQGLKSHMIPAYGEVVVVTTVFDEPIRRSAEGTTYDAILSDFAAAFKDDDGDIFEHVFDSRRFERV